MTSDAITHEFPDGFLWGAGSSAYQIEGSPLADGAKPSILHRYAHTPGNTYNGDTGDVAADHYRRFRDDVALMRELRLPAYQFSIAWPRVLPDGTGAVNARGLDFYDALVDELLSAGVAPVPVLYGWDLPGALQDRGGWANRDSAEWFAELASVVFARLGDRCSHWLTICEPFVVAYGGYVNGFLPPGMRDLFAGLRAHHHLMLGHGRAVEALRASGAKGEIGVSTSVIDVQPASDSEADRAAAERFRAFFNGMVLDPMLLGSYPREIEERFGHAWPSIAPNDMDAISTPTDFVGITYYLSMIASAEPAGALSAGKGQVLAVRDESLGVFTAWPSAPMTATDWPIYPEGVLNVLTWLSERYGYPPIIITENGGAFPDAFTADGQIEDARRIAYIRDHLAAAHKAFARGVRLRGWFVWSLLDTWEFWRGEEDGYAARFGLIHVDRATQRRTIKASGRWFRDVVKANGLSIAS